MDLVNKIALGTVQFGLDYGINNDSGQVSVKEIESIIELCKQEGIHTIDTAYSYGNSELRLGAIDIQPFQVISKVPPCNPEDVEIFFNKSLQRLNVNELYGYILHNFSNYSSDKSVWDKLKNLKKQGKIRKIGVSLYSPNELEVLWNDRIKIDLVQIPFNIFDQRFRPYFSNLKKRGTEIHVRSVFLQGLFFKNNNSLPPFFNKINGKLDNFRETVKLVNISKVEACLGWVLKNSQVDKVVVGVDSFKQLHDNISKIKKLKEKSIDWTIFDQFEEDDLNIINPSKWLL